MGAMMCPFVIVLLEKPRHNRANTVILGWNEIVFFANINWVKGVVASFRKEKLFTNFFSHL